MAVSLRDRYGSAKEVAGATAANKAPWQIQTQSCKRQIPRAPSG